MPWLSDVADETSHLRPLLSNIIVTDLRGVEALRDDRDLTSVCSEVLFVPAVTPGAADLYAVPDLVDQWVTGLQELISSRIRGEIIDYRLAAPAVARFSRYLESEPGERHALCLKAALLAHCGSQRDQPEIDEETVEFAIALSTSISRSPEIPRRSIREDELEALIAKVRLRGPLRWRELLRGRHLQRADPLVSLLDQAISSGRLRREGDLYYAVDDSASANL